MSDFELSEIDFDQDFSAISGNEDLDRNIDSSDFENENNKNKKNEKKKTVEEPTSGYGNFLNDLDKQKSIKDVDTPKNKIADKKNAEKENIKKSVLDKKDTLELDFFDDKNKKSGLGQLGAKNNNKNTQIDSKPKNNDNFLDNKKSTEKNTEKNEKSKIEAKQPVSLQKNDKK